MRSQSTFPNATAVRYIHSGLHLTMTLKTKGHRRCGQETLLCVHESVTSIALFSLRDRETATEIHLELHLEAKDGWQGSGTRTQDHGKKAGQTRGTCSSCTFCRFGQLLFWQSVLDSFGGSWSPGPVVRVQSLPREKERGYLKKRWREGLKWNQCPTFSRDNRDLERLTCGKDTFENRCKVENLSQTFRCVLLCKCVKKSNMEPEVTLQFLHQWFPAS